MTKKITKLMLNWQEYEIREYQAWRQPWANTVAYYPMISDILDHSWNNNNFTGSWYSFSNNKVILTSDLSWPLVVPTSWTEPRTVIAWISYSSSSSEWMYKFADWIYWDNGSIINSSTREGGHLKIGSSWYEVHTASSQTFDCIALVRDWTSLVVYINWNLLNTATIARNDWYFQYATSSSTLCAWTYWEIIVENKAWSAQEISDYYDQTKWNYWL